MLKLRLFAALVIAGGVLAACDDAPSQGSAIGTTKTTTSTTPAGSSSTTTTEASSVSVNVVWPGPAPEDMNVVIDSNLTRSNFMVVYDGSGSMSYDSCGSSSPNRHADGVIALKEFVKAVPVDANLGLFVFDGRGRDVRVPLDVGNREIFLKEVDMIDIGQGTPLRSAIKTAYFELKNRAYQQLGYGRYSLVIVTDGEANSGEDPTKVVNSIIDETPVEVHTVGLCFSGRHSLNQPGRTFYTDAQNPAQLIEGLKSVLAETSVDDAAEFDTQATP